MRFATRPDGKAREIVGVRPDVMVLFSSRRRAITAKTAAWVADFKAHHGREPNALELDRLQRRATLAPRRAKSGTGETAMWMIVAVGMFYLVAMNTFAGIGEIDPIYDETATLYQVSHWRRIWTVALPGALSAKVRCPRCIRRSCR